MKEKKAKKIYFNDSDDDDDEHDEKNSEDEDLYNEEETISQRKWFEEIPEDPINDKELNYSEIDTYRQEADAFLKDDIEKFLLRKSKSDSDFNWMKSIMMKGTSADKIAALSVLVQDNPVYSLDSLKTLIGMVKNTSKNDCILAMNALTELFLDTLLRPNRKLRRFALHTFTALSTLSAGDNRRRRALLVHWLFEDRLKEEYNTFVGAVKTAAADTVEATREKAVTCLLKLLIGNPEQEQQLLAALVNKLGDPSHKVASKVIYCLGTLLHEHPNMKKVVLDEIERLMFRPNVSARTQYYSVCFLTQYQFDAEDQDVAQSMIKLYFAFFKACIKTGDVDTRLMSAVLTGVNRAMPYARADLASVSDHVDTVFKLVHLGGFTAAVQALCLLNQVCHTTKDLQNRFFVALYKKLMSPQIAVTTQQAILLNLYFKALKKDKNRNRLRAFIKRLLQVVMYNQAPMACGILYLVSQFTSANKSLLCTASSKVCVEQSSESLECKSEEKAVENEEKHIKIEKDARFDSAQRNPLHAGGEHCVYYELLDLCRHFHPSVALFAKQIFNGQRIDYTGDPLKDFQLVRFLERFVFRNPKTTVAEVPAAQTTFATRKLYRPVGTRALPVTSDVYLRTQTDRIPPDEQYLHHYMQTQRTLRRKKEDDDSDLESVASEDFEEMLAKMSGFSEDNDVDFMAEIGEDLKQNEEKTSKQKLKDGEEDIEEDEAEISEDGEEFENELSDQASGEDENIGTDEEDFMNVDDVDDDLDMDFESEDSDVEEDGDVPIKRKKNSNKKMKKTDSIFASADEFAQLLEEDELNSGNKPGKSSTILNKDNSHLKQLSWEKNRDKWVKGLNKAIKKKSKIHKPRVMKKSKK